MLSSVARTPIPLFPRPHMTNVTVSVSLLRADALVAHSGVQPGGSRSQMLEDELI